MESQGIKHRAVYQYTASREDELNLKVGDIIDQVVDWLYISLNVN